jgi:hypothetical protein
MTPKEFAERMQQIENDTKAPCANCGHARIDHFSGPCDFIKWISGRPEYRCICPKFVKEGQAQMNHFRHRAKKLTKEGKEGKERTDEIGYRFLTDHEMKERGWTWITGCKHGLKTNPMTATKVKCGYMSGCTYLKWDNRTMCKWCWAIVRRKRGALNQKNKGRK